ncbi:AmiS/UreI family transporter [Marivita sp. GX14005]|uniref:AmiS/UreI family transporter n=1 Tax=Marivita sp. GX14005 TaxID=2942276 RepID=UPI0020187913|nr:AmiS/UreI family transporter [Marivita sp. GX14005]MCL3883261.1 transporter [Marivita sp. GX14005]
MMLPLSLLFVGAVLVLNGLWMTGRIADREIIVINLVTATVTGCVALVTLIRAETASDIRSVALTLLFTVTYLWVAVNRMNGADGRGLGWFSLFVAISVLPEAVQTLASAQTAMQLWLGLCWLAWSALWLLFFLTLVPKWVPERPTALATLASGILTAWLPAMFLLNGAVL